MDSDDVLHNGFSTVGHGVSDFEDDVFDFGGTNPYGIAMGDMSDGMFDEVYNNCSTMGFGGDIDDYVSHQLGDDYMTDQLDAMDFGRPDTSSSNSTDGEDESEKEDGHDIQFLEKKISPKRVLENGLKTKRHLAILRTNRQIYDEASALLHSDLTIDVNPGDAVTDGPGNAIVKPTKKVWRHAPINDISSTNSNGQTIYKSLPLDGPVEPHVFARFEKISYLADFTFEPDQAAPSLYVNDDLSVNDEDAAKFVSYLTTATSTTRWFEDPIPGRSFDNGRRETLQDVADITISSVSVSHPSTAGIIQNFVDLLSNSPFIRHLELTLTVEVRCKNPIDDLGSDSDDESDSQEAKDDEKVEVADERATELFLESGVLDPLRKLSNVKCFSFEIETMRGIKFMEPKQKYLNMVGDLKKATENNWVVKHGPR